MWPFTGIYTKIQALETKVELLATDLQAAKDLSQNNGAQLSLDAARITALEAQLSSLKITSVSDNK